VIELSLIALLGPLTPSPTASLALEAASEASAAEAQPQDLAQASPSPSEAAIPPGLSPNPTLGDRLSFAVIGSLFSITPTSSQRQALPTLPNAGEDAAFDELAWSVDGRLAAIYNLKEVYVWGANGAAPTQVFQSQCAHMPNLDLLWSAQGGTLLIKEVCDVPNSTSAGHMSLYIANAADGSSARQLPGLPADISSRPFVSPDGSQVTYVQGGHLYRLAVNAPQPQRLTTEPGVYGAAGSPLAWSPDSQQIAFFEGRYPNQRLNVINADGSNRRLLTPAQDFQIYRSRIYWSPDSSRIAFYQPVDPPYDNREVLQLVTLATGEIRTLSEPGFFDALSWSPDGQKLALASGKIENQDVYVLDLATGVFTQVSQGPLAQIMKTLWSPRGDWLAFSGEPTGQDLANQVLYTVRPDGSELRSLTSPNEYVYPFAWQP
jgi:Tol biopolymer transport system component